MDYLIAFLFISFDVESAPKYSSGNCYQAPDAEWRPSVIKINSYMDAKYNYKILYSNGWSNNLIGKTTTIESVYSINVICP